MPTDQDDDHGLEGVAEAVGALPEQAAGDAEEVREELVEDSAVAAEAGVDGAEGHEEAPGPRGVALPLELRDGRGPGVPELGVVVRGASHVVCDHARHRLRPGNDPGRTSGEERIGGEALDLRQARVRLRVHNDDLQEGEGGARQDSERLPALTSPSVLRCREERGLLRRKGRMGRRKEGGRKAEALEEGKGAARDRWIERERETERDRETEGDRDRDRDREASSPPGSRRSRAQTG